MLTVQHALVYYGNCQSEVHQTLLLLAPCTCNQKEMKNGVESESEREQETGDRPMLWRSYTFKYKEEKDQHIQIKKEK